MNDIHYFILKEWLGPFCLTMFNCLIDKTKAHLHLLITLLSPEECGEPRAEVAGQDVVADVYVLGESATRLYKLTHQAGGKVWYSIFRVFLGLPPQ